MSYPILEFDPAEKAVIEPSEVLSPHPDMPEVCVLCFFQDVITSVCAEGDHSHKLLDLGSEIGKNPLYVLDVTEQQTLRAGRVAVVHPGVGAPLAAGFLDELIALGCRKFIACGGAGVLNRELAVGHLVVPDSAVRDEGTSYHYMPPSREVAPDPGARQAVINTLEAHQIPYAMGKTWTTDGIYRETREKVARRRAEGCITVEMEAAAFFAVAQFRQVAFAQLLYSGDDLSGDVWDGRAWHKQESTRARVFWLAVEAALRI